jgi:hypothetical protein
MEDRSLSEDLLEAGATLRSRNPAGYEPQWRAYRRRRRIALFLLYGWAPFCVLAFVLGGAWLQEDLLSLVPMGLWFLAMAAAIEWAGEFRCPRCWRRFGALGAKGFVAMWSGGLFDDICPNCKLRKFTESK